MDRGRLIVQKFGGSSVADGARIRLCAQRALDASRSGCRVVVVVSAMGRTTDALLRTAHQIAPRPPRRELDQLLAAGEQVSVALVAIAIASLGGRAVGLDARQAGIVAQGVHGRSRIDRIDTSRIEQVLRDGHIAVVAGFQGELPTGELATIGRGGSDTTAVALAAALGAAICEIYTDTSGVMTADPAIVPKARCLPSLSWPAMSALAARGAKVLALDAAELARQHRVPMRIRHAALAGQGTRIEGDHWPQGPVGCTLTMQPMPLTPHAPLPGTQAADPHSRMHAEATAGQARIALVGRDVQPQVRALAERILGGPLRQEPDALVRDGLDAHRAPALLRTLHEAIWPSHG